MADPVPTALDRRLNAYRPDLADRRLEGRVEASRFVDGDARRVVASVCDVRSAPRFDAGLDTQFQRGEAVTVFEEREGWAWVQAGHDGYVGYVGSDDLGSAGLAPSHIVSVPRTFLYPGPDMKLPRRGQLGLGAAVRVTERATTRGTDHVRLDCGNWAVAGHVREAVALEPDPVAVAESLLMTPYLWGGTSAFGIDCSGLVQLSQRMAGRSVLRDTDMQAGSIGTALDIGPDLDGLRRGDLVFWKGHVGIMTDGIGMIHANGHTMTVAREELSKAIERIGYLYGGPTGFRRP